MQLFTRISTPAENDVKKVAVSRPSGRAKAKRRKPRALEVVVISFMAALLVIPLALGRAGEASADSNVGKVAVAQADIEASSQASGTLSNYLYEAKMPSGIAIVSVYVSKGDIVKAGDQLCSVSKESVDNAIASVKSSLASLDEKLSEAAKQASETVTYKAQSAGRIKAIYIEEGGSADSAMSAYGCAMLLSLDGKMKITIEDQEGIAIGDEAVVVMGGGVQKTGKLVSLEAGKAVYTLTDNGTPFGEAASVVVDGKTIGTGVLQVNAPLGIACDYGKVNTITATLEAKVKEGDTLFSVKKPTATASYATLAERKEKLLERLESLTSLSAGTKLYSPVSGTVANVAVTPGSAFSTSDGALGAAITVSATDTLQLMVPIDERDIDGVQEGMAARVEVDAISNRVFEGVIKKVDDEVDSQEAASFASPYSALIVVSAQYGMKAGMSATATIEKVKALGVVSIPLSAVQEYGDKVFVYTSYTKADGFDGATQIKTGVSDGINVQILSGVEAGQMVYYPMAGYTGLLQGLGE